MTSGPILLLLLALAILFIIVGTAKVKMHPFLVLLITAYGLGLLAGLSPDAVIEAITSGFGGTLRYIGIVIAGGTIIGAILERSGAARVMAETVIRWVGRARSALAMSVTGAVVSIPVFCDSGYVVLSPLSRSLAAQSKQSLAVYAVALSMGLYATHVFVPPTPGPIAAAGELGADIGTVIILGLITTIPVIAATYLFARYMGRRIYIDPAYEPEQASTGAALAVDAAESGRLAPWKAFAPIAVPVLLIAVQSIAALPAKPFGEGALSTLLRLLGNPNTALLLGVFIAIAVVWKQRPAVYGAWVGAGLKEAGSIILITGAGGALGMVLRTTPLGEYLGETLAPLGLGPLSILLPFVIAATLKTALGSSTVAIITTASIVAPLLGSLGLAAGLGPALTTLAIGAGSMTVSHANDSYFWVVSQFSDMTVSQAYLLQTVGSAVAGITGIAAVLAMGLVVL
jgi:GntP family gluconate:H+ symporter